MQTIHIVNVVLQIWESTLLLMICICMFSLGKKKQEIEQIFIAMLITAIASLISAAVPTQIQFSQKTYIPFLIAVMTYLSLISTQILIYGFFRLLSSFLQRKYETVVPAVYANSERAVLIILTVLLTINLAVPFLYRFDQYHRMVRLSYFPLIHASYGIAIGLDLILLLKKWSLLQKREHFMMSVSYLILLISVLFPLPAIGINYDQIGIGASLIILYVFLQSEYVPNQELQKKELAQNRISMMLSQIQPEVLFHALDSIHELCLENAPAAGAAVNHFAHYLRVNMDNITRTTPVSFHQELKHLNDYLYVAQLRMPSLRVKFDCQTEEFLLPALTLQPIVEMMRKQYELLQVHAGIIFITTADQTDATSLTVSYPGSSLSVSTSAECLQLLHSIEERLVFLCNGSLSIRDGKDGTTINILIPKTDRGAV